MSLFETATIIRTAPWLTMLIFLWSIISGLFGGHLPSTHRAEQPIRLQPALQPAWQPSIRPRQEVVMGPDMPKPPSHEGRLLQLADNPFTAPSFAHQPDSFLSELNHAASDMANFFTGGDLHEHQTPATSGDSKWSDFTQSSDLKQYEQEVNEAISHAHAASANTAAAQSASDASAANAAKSAAGGDNIEANPKATDAQHVQGSEDIGFTAAADILGLIGLPANFSDQHESSSDHAKHDSHTGSHESTHTPSHAATHMHHHHNSDSTLTGSLPETPVCPIHQDLPIPGMDIAPADKDRCYPHPHIYKNHNYLNDSYYMLYHHDIPTHRPHPAFTWGDLGRFAQVSHKMRRNEPVTVTFVGGSVSSSYCQNPSVTCWVAPVSDWLHQHNSAVQIINNAVGGTTSRTTSECFDAMVGKDADLIFLEYSYNDRFGIEPAQQQQGYELLVRKLLKLPNKPAVVIVHWWGPKHDCLQLVSKQEAEQRSPDHPHHQCAMTLWNSTEDQIQSLVEHYGVQSISFRNAYWAEIDAELQGFLPDDTLMPDLIHPSKRGVELLGDLVTKFLGDISAYTARHDHMHKGMSHPLPDPLFIAAGLDEQSNTCNRGNALQDMKMHTVDWYWVDGKKPGFQTDVPGASLVLMVMLPEDQQVDKLSLGYLASYENMGWAQIECLGACSCPVLKIDANSTARASQEHFTTFRVQRQETGDGCVLKITTLYMTSAVNEGHRFKVSSVAWSGQL